MREQQGVAMRRSNARRKARRSSAQRKATAYHEASHAVIGRVLTCVCGGAKIKTSKRGRGKGITPPPDTKGERRGKKRGDTGACHPQSFGKKAGGGVPGVCKKN